MLNVKRQDQQMMTDAYWKQLSPEIRQFAPNPSIAQKQDWINLYTTSITTVENAKQKLSEWIEAARAAESKVVDIERSDGSKKKARIYFSTVEGEPANKILLYEPLVTVLNYARAAMIIIEGMPEKRQSEEIVRIIGLLSSAEQQLIANSISDRAGAASTAKQFEKDLRQALALTPEELAVARDCALMLDDPPDIVTISESKVKDELKQTPDRWYQIEVSETVKIDDDAMHEEMDDFEDKIWYQSINKKLGSPAWLEKFFAENKDKIIKQGNPATPSSRWRSIPANLKREHHIIAKYEEDKGLEQKFAADELAVGILTPFNIPDRAERIKAIQRAIQAILEVEYEKRVQAYFDKFGALHKDGDVIDFPVTYNTLLSPLRGIDYLGRKIYTDNNGRFLEEVQEAIDEMLKESEQAREEFDRLKKRVDETRAAYDEINTDARYAEYQQAIQNLDEALKKRRVLLHERDYVSEDNPINVRIVPQIQHINCSVNENSALSRTQDSDVEDTERLIHSAAEEFERLGEKIDEDTQQCLKDFANYLKSPNVSFLGKFGITNRKPLFERKGFNPNKLKEIQTLLAKGMLMKSDLSKEAQQELAIKIDAVQQLHHLNHESYFGRWRRRATNRNAFISMLLWPVGGLTKIVTCVPHIVRYVSGLNAAIDKPILIERATGSKGVILSGCKSGRDRAGVILTGKHAAQFEVVQQMDQGKEISIPIEYRLLAGIQQQIQKGAHLIRRMTNYVGVVKLQDVAKGFKDMAMRFVGQSKNIFSEMLGAEDQEVTSILKPLTKKTKIGALERRRILQRKVELASLDVQMQKGPRAADEPAVEVEEANATVVQQPPAPPVVEKPVTKAPEEAQADGDKIHPEHPGPGHNRS